jgi:hypothetical protein
MSHIHRAVSTSRWKEDITLSNAVDGQIEKNRTRCIARVAEMGLTHWTQRRVRYCFRPKCKKTDS